MRVTLFRRKFLDNGLVNRPNVVVFVNRFHLSTMNNLNDQPMLTNEYFKAECIISNTFDVALQNVGISITVPASFKNKGNVIISTGKIFK